VEFMKHRAKHYHMREVLVHAKQLLSSEEDEC
jgi:hypothetical protein